MSYPANRSASEAERKGLDEKRALTTRLPSGPEESFADSEGPILAFTTTPSEGTLIGTAEDLTSLVGELKDAVEQASPDDFAGEEGRSFQFRYCIFEPRSPIRIDAIFVVADNPRKDQVYCQLNSLSFRRITASNRPVMTYETGPDESYLIGTEAELLSMAGLIERSVEEARPGHFLSMEGRSFRFESSLLDSKSDIGITRTFVVESAFEKEELLQRVWER